MKMIKTLIGMMEKETRRMMMMDKYEFKQLDNGNYAFTLTTEKFTRTEEISYETAKETYKAAKTEKQKFLDQLNHTRAEIDKLDYKEPDEDVKKLIESLGRIELHKRWLQLDDAMKNLNGMIEKIDQQIKDMLAVCPEFGRAKK